MRKPLKATVKIVFVMREFQRFYFHDIRDICRESESCNSTSLSDTMLPILQKRLFSKEEEIDRWVVSGSFQPHRNCLFRSSLASNEFKQDEARKAENSYLCFWTPCKIHAGTLEVV